MSTRTIIEINHDQLAFLLAERQQVFPILLETLRAGEAPCWVGRSFIQGDGIRILGQRQLGEPEWRAPDAPPPATSREIALMAGAILGQPEGTCDNRHPYWLQAVEQAIRAHKALYVSRKAA